MSRIYTPKEVAKMKSYLIVRECSGLEYEEQFQEEIQIQKIEQQIVAMSNADVICLMLEEFSLDELVEEYDIECDVLFQSDLENSCL